MEISVTSILQSPENVTRYDFAEQFEMPSAEEKLADKVTGELVVTRASDRILQLSGNMHSLLKLNCHRCGSEFELPIDFQLDEALEVIDGPSTSDEVEDVVSAQGHLDATDLIRQSLLLSLPTRYLCGCAPLAQPQDTDAVDPRWAALKTLAPGLADSADSEQE
jgi:uncharacterized metal-binding protein YceD (DUF177 family)